MYIRLYFLLFSFFVLACNNKRIDTKPVTPVKVTYARLGNESIIDVESVTLHNKFFIGFSKDVSPNKENFVLREGNNLIPFSLSQNHNTEIILIPENALIEGKHYTLTISPDLTADDGSDYAGISYTFSITINPLQIITIKADDIELNTSEIIGDIALNPKFIVHFSHELTAESLKDHVELQPNHISLQVKSLGNQSFELTVETPLLYWKNYALIFSQELGSSIGRSFTKQEFNMFTTLDEELKFPEISDDALLTKIQHKTFTYFWNHAHPVSGLARERNTSEEVVTIGGTGFGLMSMVIAVERGFITKSQAIQRWEKIVHFLETADRFHGAWPHWVNGSTGKVIPFSEKDNGADLVETAFLVQGLLTVKEYLDSSNINEQSLITKINTLWHEIEWNWFQKEGERVLTWHWSPEYEWDINLKIRGHNETQLVYILAASSPTFSINKEVYEIGYTQNGTYTNGNYYYNTILPAGPKLGGPLFFSHYSYLGLDPRNLNDGTINYWLQNINQTIINYKYCVDNPKHHFGYSNECWGLTASDNQDGYSAHSPTNDIGVITPSAAISSLPYTPEQSMAALKFFYYRIGDRVWGKYGFIDAFNPSEEWYAESFLAIDQGPIICMIENYRTGLLWDTFMRNQDIINGLNRLNFTF